MIPFTHLRQRRCLKHLKLDRQVSIVIKQGCLKMKGSTRLNWTTKTRRRRMMERRKKWAKSSLRRRPSPRWPGGSANTSSPTSPSNLSCSSTGLSGELASSENHSTIAAFFRSIDRVASSQLILDKTCLNDYGFAPDICDDLQHHDANNTVVQVF